MSIKIIYIIDAYQAGGAERFLTNLLTCRERHQEFNESICTLREPGFLKKLKVAGIEVMSLSLRRGPGYGPMGSKYQSLLRGLQSFLLLPRLVRFLKSANPHIVVVIGYPANIMVALASIPLRTIKYIYRVSNLRGQLIPAERTLMGWVFSRYSKLISVAEAVRKSVLIQFPNLEHRCIVIPNGIPLPPFQEGQSSQVSSRSTQQFGLNPVSVVFVNTARFTPEKGHLQLIEAFKLARAKTHTIHLLLAGDGPLLDVMKQMIISYQLTNSVKLLGNVENVYEILACGDVFVFPSFEEGSPNSIFEAMSIGLPVIAYNIPSIREIIENHVTGILVPEGDIEALAEAILTLANDRPLRTEMGKRAKEQIERKYRVEIMRRSYEQVFCEVLGICKV